MIACRDIFRTVPGPELQERAYQQALVLEQRLEALLDLPWIARDPAKSVTFMELYGAWELLLEVAQES